MNIQYMTSSELKTWAKDLLDGRFGSAILILFLGNMIPGALSMMVNSFLSTFQVLLTLPPLAYVLLSLLTTMVFYFCTNFFSAGYALFFLNIACRRSCDVGNLFYGFKWQFKKCLLLSVFFTAVNFILQLPYNACFGMFQQTNSLYWLMGALLTSTVALIIGIPFYLVFSQCYYLMLDFPDYSAEQLLRGSMQIMKGHMGRLFYLQVSFIPLILLALLTCGIGMLWLRPYMQMTYTCFFLNLMNPRKVTEEASTAS